MTTPPQPPEFDPNATGGMPPQAPPPMVPAEAYQAPEGQYQPPAGQYPPTQGMPGAAPVGAAGYGYLPPNVSPKSKVVAGVLGILLGGLGIHRFYLGYVGIGILQIVVSILTLGLGNLWGFIEGILILVAKPGSSYSTDAEGRLLQ